MLSVKVGPPGTKLHDTILNAVKERKSFSERKMKEFHTQWDKADDSVRAYIKERDVDKKRKDKKSFAGEVDYVTLEVPYTYAIVMTAHTYYCSTILSARAPIFQFTGRHGESQDSVMAVEAIMDYQCRSGGMIPPFYNWLYDLAKYSVGIVGEYWEREEKIVSKYQAVPNVVNGVQFAGSTPQLVQEIQLGYIGNKVFNVRPYDFYPDPRVPLWKFQDGEFVIRDTSEGYFDILATEHTYPGYYQNLDRLKDVLETRGTGIYTGASPGADGDNQGSSRVNRPYQPGEGNAPGPGFLRIQDAYIKLIPSMWGLSPSKRVEIWCFQIANNALVISAKPLGLYHNRFPYSLMEGNFGSDEFAKFGMVEIIRPLTDILTWLVNSHFYNVRRILNNQLVFDPSRVTVKDLTKAGQRLIRLKPQAYGTDPRMAIHQLQMYDPTSGHLQQASYIEQMIQRCSAVVDQIMGVGDPGGRKSATESRIITGSSTSRLRTPIEYNSYLGIDPMAERLLSNTQQLLDVDRVYAVAGNTLQNATAFLNAGPQQIAGAYNHVPVNGTAPIDRLAQANFWKELLMGVARVPQVMMGLDIVSMIGHIMMMQGERNFDRFRIQVAPPGAAPGSTLGGNVVPIGGTNGRSKQPTGAGGHPQGSSGGTI